MRAIAAATLVLAAGLLAGCGGTPSAVPASPSAKAPEAHNHNHDRKGMMLAHSGKYHFWLTAHLSKDGHELDLLCDDGDDTDPKPIALPVAKIVAKAKRARDEQEFELTFEPAPAGERPKDEPAGSCSHFVAKAPWLKPDDVLTVIAEVNLDGRVRRPAWRQFIIAKYTHAAE